MTSPINDGQVEQLRSKVSEVLEHAKSDATYLAQLRRDPEGTLSAAGLPEAAVIHVIRETDLGGDVAGYMFDPISDDCQYTCDTVTCIVTRCVNIPYTGTQ